MKILQIISSGKGENSISTKLADAIVEKIKLENPKSSVIVKDLSKEQLPHLTPEILRAFNTPAESRTEDQKRDASFSDISIAEIIGADIIVVGMAFYNYSVGSSLIDHISRAGITFKYDASGQQVGLLQSKPVYVAFASGGIYNETPMKEMDFARPYFAHALKMIGLTDVKFFTADGLGISGYRENSLQNAIENIAL